MYTRLHQYTAVQCFPLFIQQLKAVICSCETARRMILTDFQCLEMLLRVWIHILLGCSKFSCQEYGGTAISAKKIQIVPPLQSSSRAVTLCSTRPPTASRSTKTVLLDCQKYERPNNMRLFINTQAVQRRRNQRTNMYK